uniref:CSON014020 protein n=1 Tax=Culicoides sonorensis TaxID=179676 RepID=A0A336M9L7_CULSO
MDIKIEINPIMCRLCFKDNVTLHCDIESCQELIQNIAQIQLQPDEHLPNKVCKGCYNMLEIGNEIRKRCLESVTLFSDLLNEKLGVDEIPISASSIDDGEVENHEIVYDTESGLESQGFACCMCTLIVDNSTDLIEHQTNVHKWEYMNAEVDVENERCLVCMKLFDSMSSKMKHRTCAECMETFYSEEDLAQHHEEMHSDNMDTEYLDGEDILIEDVEIHETNTDDLVYRVVETSESERHDSSQPRKKRTYEKSAITIEREKNRKPKRKAKYGCCQCTAQANTKVEMKEHFQIEHKELVNNNDVWGHACFLCNSCFESRQDLLKHVNAPRMEEFHCDIEGCGEIFQSQGQLRKHFDTTHYGDHIFKCDQCDKEYLRQSSLNHHKYIMHDVRSNFYCDKCDKVFHRKAFWKEHMNSHNGIKTYQCTVCESAFARRTGLQAHMRKHTGERPYECKDCDKRYSHFTDLKRHRYTHTGEYPFMCLICEKGFSKRSAFETHNKNHTKKNIVLPAIKNEASLESAIEEEEDEDQSQKSISYETDEQKA